MRVSIIVYNCTILLFLSKSKSRFYLFHKLLFIVGHTRRILSRLHNWWYLVDNDFILGASWCCIRSARTST